MTARIALHGPVEPPPEEGRAFLDVAARIGRRLCRDALWAGERCNWLGWTLAPMGATSLPVYVAAGGNVYSGTAGIAIFLGELLRHVSDPHLSATLSGALTHAASVSRTVHQGGGGLYGGLAGVSYVLLSLGEKLDQPGWIETGLTLLDEAARDCPRDDGHLDMMGGVAGSIAVLLDLGQRHRRPDLVAEAIRRADQLVGRAQRDERGISWPCSMPRRHNLTGFAHGTAGILSALLDAFQASGERRFLDVAREALKYERSWFDPARAAWPDLRLAGGAPEEPWRYPVAWCHGTVGIGYSRLRVRALIPEDVLVDQEIEAAVSSAEHLLRQTSEATDFGLCHGLAGAADFLIEAAVRLGRPDLLRAPRRFGSEAALLASSGWTWPCGNQNRGESPSLLAGVAGIGLVLLRLLDPHGVASPLLPFGRLPAQPRGPR